MLALLLAAALQAPVEARYTVVYHHAVKNRTQAPLEGVVVYLPIPPSDGVQTVTGYRVDTGGLALDVSGRKDAYGTRIRRVALPRLEPGAEVEVGFTCTVALRAPERHALERCRHDPALVLAADERARYTADASLFQLEHAAVAAPASELARAHRKDCARALAIHDHVAERLDYRSGDGWDAAPVVLERGHGSCSEFSYAFAALCRASGLPTRFAGGSIFPTKSQAPFEDRGWHRYVEVWLDGHGWVPFDATLDRGRPARRAYAGARYPRMLVLTRIGSTSLQLGRSYIGANNKTGETTRRRWFTWSEAPPEDG
jgi:transglutaminase-like putative cysteine protease